MEKQKPNKKRADGLKIFYWMIDACGGCNARAAILAAVWSYCNSGARQIAQSALEALTGTGNRQTRKVLQGLETAGYIKASRKTGAANAYCLTAEARRQSKEADHNEAGARFLYVPMWAIDYCRGFTVKTALLSYVYSNFRNNQKDGGAAWGSYQHLASRFGCKRRIVIYAANELVKAGAIERASPAGDSAFLFRADFLQRLKTAAESVENLQGGAKSAGVVVQKVPGGGAKSAGVSGAKSADNDISNDIFYDILDEIAARTPCAPSGAAEIPADSEAEKPAEKTESPAEAERIERMLAILRNGGNPFTDIDRETVTKQ